MQDETANIYSRDRYFDWLVDMVKGDNFYISLLTVLYKIPFHASIDSVDHNRRLAGIRLRDRFRNETHRRFPVPSKPCTFLEMVLALALEMDDKILYEHRFGDRYLDWFWYIIDNMGFSRFTDGEWDMDKERYVRDRVKKILNHDYATDGVGGMFPVYNHPEADMREIDIWRQAFWWIDENLKSGRIE